MTRRAPLLAAAACGLLVAGCSGTPQPPAVPYFGERTPGSVARVFAPGKISLEGRYEYALSFAPAGDELLFTAEMPEQGSTVYYSRFENGGWTTPRALYLTQRRRRSEMEAFYTPDGSRIYFAAYNDGMDVRLWAVDRGRKGWDEAWPLEVPIARDPSFYPTATDSGTVYYHNRAQDRIYRAVVTGQTIARVADAELEFGVHPFVAPDESFVILDAQLELDGEFDLYVAFRREDGRWTLPVDLGPEVNTEDAETCPSLSPDGRFLFFSRYDEPGGVSNIYWISSVVIDRARSRAGAPG